MGRREWCSDVVDMVDGGDRCGGCVWPGAWRDLEEAIESRQVMYVSAAGGVTNAPMICEPAQQPSPHTLGLGTEHAASG